MDVLKRVNRELNQEMRKQVDLIYSAAAIAFARYWDKGWGPERIRRIFDKTLETWNECGATNQISMIQMLENESGIELRIPNMDKGWRELAARRAPEACPLPASPPPVKRRRSTNLSRKAPFRSTPAR